MKKINMNIFKKLGIIFMACFMVIGMTGCSKPKNEAMSREDVRNYEKQNALNDYMMIWKKRELLQSRLSSVGLDITNNSASNTELTLEQSAAFAIAYYYFMNDINDIATERLKADEKYLDKFDNDYLDHLALMKAYAKAYKKDKPTIEAILDGKSTADISEMKSFILSAKIADNSYNKIDVPVQKIQEAKNSVK